MAETRALEAVIDPGEREGREVSFAEDPALIVRAFKKGWIKSVELADQLLREAIEDTAAIRGVCDPLDLVRASQGLAQIAQGAVNMRTRAIQVAEGQQATGTTNNTQVNIDVRGNDAIVAELRKQFSVDELKLLRDKMQANGNGKH